MTIDRRSAVRCKAPTALATRLLFLVLGLLIGLTVTEGVLRTTALGSLAGAWRAPANNDRHPLFGFFYRPNSEFVYNTEYVQFGTSVRINAKGLRGPDYSYAKEEGVFRLLVLGDSFTASLEVSLEQVWHRILEERLNSRVRRHSSIKRVEIIAAGVQGWSTDQELLYYRHEGHKYQPDLVVLQFLPNDVSENDVRLSPRIMKAKPHFVLDGDALKLVSPVDGQQDVQARPRPEGGWAKRIRWELRNRLVAYRLVGSFLRSRPRPRLRRFCYEAVGIPRELFIYAPTYPSDYARAWKLTLRLVRELRDEVRKRGQQFVVVYFPPRRQALSEAWKETLECWPTAAAVKWDLDKPNTTLGDFLQRINVPYLDVTPAIRRYVSRTGRSVYFALDPHLNPEGHRVVADQLAEWIDRKRLLSRESAP